MGVCMGRNCTDTYKKHTRFTGIAEDGGGRESKLPLPERQNRYFFKVEL